MKKNKQKISNCDSAVKPKTSLKTFFGIGLAGLIIASGFMAFAPFNQPTAKAETTLPQSTSPFGLNPETDPVIYTTESGLDIKFGGATLSSGSLNGYTYFTMGGVDWAIIGRSSQGFGGKGATLASYFTNNSNSTEVTNWANAYFDLQTPYGNTIWNDDTINDPVVSGTKFSFSSKEATSTTIDNELAPGEVLCFAVTNIESEQFDAESGYLNDYNSSDCELKALITSYCTKTDGVFSSAIGFTEAQMRSIQPQDLINMGTSTSTTTGAYLFPLATTSRSSSQNFCIETYLSTNALRDIDANYWLRSGNASIAGNAYIVRGDGTLNHGERVPDSYGVRPAFVLKLA